MTVAAEGLRHYTQDELAAAIIRIKEGAEWFRTHGRNYLSLPRNEEELARVVEIAFLKGVQWYALNCWQEHEKRRAAAAIVLGDASCVLSEVAKGVAKK